MRTAAPAIFALDRLVSRERVRAYALMLVAGYGLAAAYLASTLRDGVDRFGRAPGSDFITFYAASALARRGEAAAAFDLGRIAAAEQAVAPVADIYAWHYPPTFQLLVAPLAFVPYGLALAAWTAATLGLFLATIRWIRPGSPSLLVALALPALFVNVMHGQNAALVAALLGFGLLAADRRPWLAGAALGLLAIKPHLAALVPFLLLAEGRWKALAAAALSALALCAASLAAYGPDAWIAFARDLPAASALVRDHHLPWTKIPSVFVGALSLGLPASVAYALHGGVALALAAITLRAWRAPGPRDLKVALAVPAALAISPYCFDYDLVLLALPIAVIARQGRPAPPPGVKALLAFAYLSPLAFTGLAVVTGVQLMWLAVLAAFAAAWRTLAAEQTAAPAAVAGDQAAMRARKTPSGRRAARLGWMKK